MARISASIVIYKTPIEQLNAVVGCIVDSKTIEKLYVIDNSPNKQNSEFFQKFDFAEYIPHENTGYGDSHNVALKKTIAEGFDYHIVLNSDIEFEPKVIRELEEYMVSNKDVVYILPKVIYPNGDLQYLCKLLPNPFDLILRRFFKNSKFLEKNDDKYTLKFSGYDKIMNPPCLSGCFMFLRLKTLSYNNIFFDERFFLYLEDFDLIRRLHRVGKTIYYPYVSIVHNHSKESYKSKKMLFIHIRSAILYFNKFGWFFDKERKLFNSRIIKEIEEFNRTN